MRWTKVKVRRLMVTVAFLGLIMGAIRFAFTWESFMGTTVYAPGYSEQKFHSVRVGMTPAQVEAILGPPLQRRAWGGLSDVSFYSYSDTPDDTGNFSRRWVVWKDGKVA